MKTTPTSVTEIANLVVIPDQSDSFIINFKLAEPLISRQPGYISHRLIRHIQSPNRFILIVEWESISAHQNGFRQSGDYAEWKTLLHHFYDPFPTVEYYKEIPRQ